MSYYRQGPRRPGGPGGVALGVPQVTPMVKKLIIANAAIWVLQATVDLIPAIGYPGLATWLGAWPSRIASGWIWQVATYQFLHGGPFHLLFNMLYLWMFGSELERAWGQRSFLNYYLVCGTGAGVIIAIAGILAGSGAYTIGASGAIYGLILAFGIVFAERTVLFMLIFPIKARTMALILVGISFFYSLSTPGDGVSHLAHLGGALVGFLYLKRAWRFGEFVRQMRWKWARRRFKVMSRDDDDWVH